MMTYQKMGHYVAAEPFRPFRIESAGDRTFDIRHPEMVGVGRTTMIIFTDLSDDPDLINEREVRVSLPLVQSVELLEPPALSQGHDGLP